MTQTENTFWIFMDLLKVKLSKTKFLEVLRTHPDFLGFNSISDLLTELNIENVTLKASTEEIKNFPKPQLIELKDEKHNYAIITATNNGSVEYLLNSRKISEPISSFNEKWNNVVLVAETNNKSGELNFKQSRKNQLLTKIRRLVTTFIFVFVVILQLITNGQIKELQLFPYIFTLLTKFAGLFISTLLLYKTFFPMQGGLLDRICDMGKNIKCSDILESKGAKLFGLISWSEIGALYFTGGFISLLFIGYDSSLISFLALLAIVSVLYVFYSVFYQLFVVKKWCTLCLLV